MISRPSVVVAVLIVFAVQCLLCATSSLPSSSTSAKAADSSEFGFASGIKVLYRTYQQCEQQEDLLSCLKLKALKFADRALKVKNIPIVDGMALVKKDDEEGSRQMKELSEDVNEESLPVDPEKRQEALDDFLLDRVSRFLKSHTLQFSVPKFISELDESFGENDTLEEGRGKLKKYGGALLMGLLMKGGMLAMAYKGIALLAGKALLVAKIALVLSAVIGLKKLVGSGGDEKVTYEIVKHPHVSHSHAYSHDSHFGGGGGHYDSSGGGGDHYRRSIDSPMTPSFYPHLMAYRGQTKGTNVTPATQSQ
ncbi:uncharacterized protein Osi11 [Periplaneta americana]|uniref:uncharacterized protein Osi11 n=1 Tax=Periplaneta americana TaxID=6978 RepID=UPI0037E9ABD5